MIYARIVHKYFDIYLVAVEEAKKKPNSRADIIAEKNKGVDWWGLGLRPWWRPGMWRGVHKLAPTQAHVLSEYDDVALHKTVTYD